MTEAARIDVHQHLLPPEFVAALERHGLARWAPVGWSIDGALAVMDEHQIATSILSLSTPGPHMGDDAEGRVLCRQINERLSDQMINRPDRFGMFASVPLPDIDGSLEAISYAYDHLSCDGVVLLASNQGKYLGDPAFDEVMAELDRRSALVFVHPGPLAGAPVPGLHPVLTDLLLDTVRAAVNMVLRGIPKRFPHLRFILSHGGGFLPYAAYRTASLAPLTNPAYDYEEVMNGLSSYYFDTALASSPSSLPSLLQFARTGHVLFGSDWPYSREKTVTFFTNFLDGHEGLNEAGHAAINRGNAEALFPRLAAYR